MPNPTTITVPFTAEDEHAGWFVDARAAWVTEAEKAGIVITDETFDYTTVDCTADEDTTVSAARIDGTWYVLEFASDEVTAREAC